MESSKKIMLIVDGKIQSTSENISSYSECNTMAIGVAKYLGLDYHNNRKIGCSDSWWKEDKKMSSLSQKCIHIIYNEKLVLRYETERMQTEIIFEDNNKETYNIICYDGKTILSEETITVGSDYSNGILNNMNPPRVAYGRAL